VTKVLKDLLARKASRALRVPLVKMEPLVREALKGPKEPQGPKAPQDLRVPRELKEALVPVGLKEPRAHVAPPVPRAIQVGLRDQRALWDRLDHWDLRG
jgi:hypothetical protein